MMLGLLPAKGRTLDRLDTRTRADVEAYSKAFNVVDLSAAPHLAKRCRVIRVMNLNRMLPALRAKAAWGIPYVLQLGYDHAELARIHGRPGKAFAWRILRTVACFSADGIIVSAHDLERRWRIKVRFPRAVVRVIPNGVDLSR